MSQGSGARAENVSDGETRHALDGEGDPNPSAPDGLLDEEPCLSPSAAECGPAPAPVPEGMAGDEPSEVDAPEGVRVGRAGVGRWRDAWESFVCACCGDRVRAVAEEEGGLTCADCLEGVPDRSAIGVSMFVRAAPGARRGDGVRLGRLLALDRPINSAFDCIRFGRKMADWNTGFPREVVNQHAHLRRTLQRLRERLRDQDRAARAEMLAVEGEVSEAAAARLGFLRVPLKTVPAAWEEFGVALDLAARARRDVIPDQIPEDGASLLTPGALSVEEVVPRSEGSASDAPPPAKPDAEIHIRSRAGKKDVRVTSRSATLGFVSETPSDPGTAAERGMVGLVEALCRPGLVLEAGEWLEVRPSLRAGHSVRALAVALEGPVEGALGALGLVACWSVGKRGHDVLDTLAREMAAKDGPGRIALFEMMLRSGALSESEGLAVSRAFLGPSPGGKGVVGAVMDLAAARDTLDGAEPQPGAGPEAWSLRRLPPEGNEEGAVHRPVFWTWRQGRARELGELVVFLVQALHPGAPRGEMFEVRRGERLVMAHAAGALSVHPEGEDDPILADWVSHGLSARAEGDQTWMTPAGLEAWMRLRRGREVVQVSEEEQS